MTEKKFTWVETHKELTQFLRTKENSQIELIGILKSVGINPFNDKAKLGDHDIELDEIDPFTFFCYIYKYGPERRLKYLQKIAENLKISIPNDDSGIPSANAQKVWLFPYKYDRVNNEIERLWNFFKKAINSNITDDDFADVLSIRNVAKAKISEALFNINPEKYFPINGPTKQYLKNVLGIEPIFETYSDYIALLENIKRKISIPFYELSYEAWKWNDARSKLNYWVFQGNPKIYNVIEALNDNMLTTWSIKAHDKKIKVGDKIILWVTGKDQGCYALGEVTSEVYEGLDEEDQIKYYTEQSKNEISKRVKIKITKNLSNSPLTKDEIENISELNELKVGNQGTNFSATEEEYEILLELAQKHKSKKYWIYAPGENATLWDEFYSQGIMGLGWDRIGDINNLGDKESLIKIIQEKYKTESKSYNNALANLEFRDAISVGDIIIPKKGRQEYLGYGIVTSDYYYDQTRTTFQKCRKVEWKKKGVWPEVKGDIVLKTLTDITKYPDYIDKLIKLIGIEENETSKKANPMNMKLSLNTILYGPPGTGKTYILKNKYMPMFTSSENSITRDEFLRDVIQNCSWWQVIALAVLDIGKTKVSGIFNHEFVQIKAQLSNSATVTPTIWGQLQSHTIEECEHVKVQKRMPPFIFNKTENSEWEILMDDVKEQAPELLQLNTKIANFSHIPNIKIERFEFLTFHQSYSYEDFIEGIKPELSESDVAYKIEEGVFQKMCNRARNDSSNNYAIFIDEINRGNISSIFGELITLIEEDKREGKPNQIKATLPYSKTIFSVPNNLFIIGTMNTADRSIEALDTALRRRFSFIEMNPDPQKLREVSFKCEGVDLEKLLLSINGRIEKLLDKDYCIGHSYFMNIEDRNNPIEELRIIFQNKILPLLQEYFYGDWGKIMLVMGKEFVFKKTDTVKFLTAELIDEYEEYNDKPIYGFTESQKWTLNSFKSIYE
jgi:predicted Mrr-cat superfamily restriction endonuclease